MKLTKWTLVALSMGLSSAAAMSACGGKDNTIDKGAGGGGGQGGAGAQLECVPDQVSCANEFAVQQCRADGSGYVVVPCPDGESCTDGECKPAGACSPGASSCLDTSTRITCMQDGAGYEEVTCPDTAPCVDGVCMGPVCNAGETKCDPNASSFEQLYAGLVDTGVVYTCVDGLRWEASRCDVGEQCVYSSLDPGFDIKKFQVEARAFFEGDGDIPPPALPSPGPSASASCVAPECELPNYEFFEGTLVCGDPTKDGEDKSKSYSQCLGVAPFVSPHWVNTECSAPETCTGNYIDPCSSVCLPGESQCYNGFYVSCKDDGTWGEPEFCEEGAEGPQACYQWPYSNGQRKAACVDAACFYFMNNYTGWEEDYEQVGECAGDKIKTCDPATGQLKKSEDCDNGSSCTNYTTASYYNGSTYVSFSPGVCEQPCEDGARFCTTSPFYMECVEGKWEAMACQAGTSCYGLSSGLDGYQTEDIVCGACEPGEGYCDGNGDRVTCGENGQYGDPEPCDSGTCIVSNDGVSGDNKAVCGFTCVPGAIQCNGGTQSRTCLDDGTWGAYEDCAEGTGCRRDGGGEALGCVECVGSENNSYYGPDKDCDPDGLLRTCQADHTWGTGTACSGDLVCAETSSNLGNEYQSLIAACQEPAEEVIVQVQ